MVYSFWLAAKVLLYASSHRQDNTYHDLCYTSCGALAGTRNSSMGRPHEGSIRRPIAPWANALTTELHLASRKGPLFMSRWSTGYNIWWHMKKANIYCILYNVWQLCTGFSMSGCSQLCKCQSKMQLVLLLFNFNKWAWGWGRWGGKGF